MPIVPSRSREIHALLERLGSASAAERDAAVARLTLFGGRALEPLRGVLRAGTPRERLAALAAVESIRDPRVLPELLALVRARDAELARRAIEATAGFARPETAAALAEALGSRREALRRAAAAGLVRLHEAGVVEALGPLLDLLLDEQAAEGLRLPALEAVARLDPKEREPILERLRGTRATTLAAHVSALLATAAPRSRIDSSGEVARFLSARASQQEAAFERLASLGPPLGGALVDALLAESRPEPGRRLGRALRRLGVEQLDLVHGALEGTANSVAMRVLSEVLGEWRSPASIPVLHRLLQRLAKNGPSGDESLADVAAHVHVALASLGSRIALYDLRERLAAGPPRESRPLLEAAAAVGDASLVPALAALAHDAPESLDACAVALAAMAAREGWRRPPRKGVRKEQLQTLEALWRGGRRGRGRAPKRG